MFREIPRDNHSMTKYSRKILFVTPPFYRLYNRLYKNFHPFFHYPLALGYLTATVKKYTDWEVMAYHADFCCQSVSLEVSFLTGEGFYNYVNNLNNLDGSIWKEVVSVLSEFKPSVVGISASSQTFASACNVARLVKGIFKQAIVILGGPHASMAGAEILNNPDIDIVVKGEGEATIVELLKAIEERGDLQNIKGISYRKDAQICENAPRELITELDSLCFSGEYVEEVLKDYAKYPLEAFSQIMTIRGCPYNCFFCGSRKIWTQKVRFRSIENVVKEIQGLTKKGLKYFRFADDMFGVNRYYLNDLCQALIAHCPGIAWDCEMHVKLVDECTVSLMKKAGCVSIQIGMESGNNEILKMMRKGITAEEAFSAAKVIKKHRIALTVFFMVGFPQETEKTLEDTVRAMKKVAPCFLVYSIFMPYPGTEAFEFCKANGLINDSYDVSLYNHQSPLNHFCLNISLEKFRRLVSKIERMVDKMNRPKIRDIIAQIFSLRTLRKICELGLIERFKRCIKLR